MTMKPGISLAPRYCHLLEVLDGAASLQSAIRHAESALMEPALDPEERDLLESVLEVSRDRLARVGAILQSPDQVLDRTEPDDHDDGILTGRQLREAGRSAGEGSQEAETGVIRALDRLARSMDTSGRHQVEPFLSHACPALRASAMKVLVLHWRMSEYTDHVLWTLISDGEAECRRVAALCLGSLYEGSANPDIGRELARSLTRPEEEQDVLWAACWALMAVDGVGQSGRPLPIRDFDPARDIDRALLGRYAGSD